MPKPSPMDVEWIAPLAEPYLRGYQPRRQSGGALRGWWFHCLASKGRTESQGFFVGYLSEGSKWQFLSPEPPEVLVFAFVQPVKGAAHRRLVAAAGSPTRKIFEYIRWLTHRPPRFQFFDSQLPVLIRHASMRDWPAEKREHYSRNFFIETLAWLVRSGIVKQFLQSPTSTRTRKAS